MNLRVILPLSAAIAAWATAGCGKGDDVDTSPLPSQSAQSRVDRASKSVESSNMSPEQKQAATAYLRQGAAGAEQIRKTAGAAGAPGGVSR